MTRRIILGQKIDNFTFAVLICQQHQSDNKR